jgi:N-acyl-D-amino-acid deacylase
MTLDVLIRDSLIVDGTGNPWFKADIGVKGERISGIGRFASADAERVIDATRLIASPGFIDSHSHSDFTMLLAPTADSKIMQGVTTEVCGLCGASAAPVRRDRVEELNIAATAVGISTRLSSEEPIPTYDWSTVSGYLDTLDKMRISVNFATFVGHANIRVAVMGLDPSAPTRDQMDEMKALLSESMKDGAFGMSTGLTYSPGSNARTNELVELSKLLPRFGGIYNTHLRGEKEEVLESLREAIEIGERSGAIVHISHRVPKMGGWGKGKEMSKLMDEARERGLDITADEHSYTAGMPGLVTALPPWTQSSGTDKMIELLRDQRNRQKLKKEMLQGFPGPSTAAIVKHQRWDRMTLTYAEANKNLIGSTFDEIANKLGKDPFDVVFDLLISNRGNVMVTCQTRSLEDIRTALKHHLTMIGSDGKILQSHGELRKIKDVRSYGTYARLIEKWVVQDRLLTLEEAINKATSFPAQRLMLRERGLIKEGMYADIVIFDKGKVKDKATYNNPTVSPEGIEYVLVNGQVVVEHGRHTGALPGMILRRQMRS